MTLQQDLKELKKEFKALMEKTTFNEKMVANILQRTYKMRKIKRVAKGIYVRA